MVHRLTAAAIVASLAGISAADIVITQGNNPISGEENITFPAGFPDNATLVQGRTGVTPFRIDFFGAGEVLTTPDATPDRVLAADGAFRLLTMSPTVEGSTVGSFTVNLTALTGGSVILDILEFDGPGWNGATFGIGNGQNFFTIEAVNGGRIRSVSLSSNIDITSARNMKASSMLVPEPATLAATAFGIGFILRRRRRK